MSTVFYILRRRKQLTTWLYVRTSVRLNLYVAIRENEFRSEKGDCLKRETAVNITIFTWHARKWVIVDEREIKASRDIRTIASSNSLQLLWSMASKASLSCATTLSLPYPSQIIAYLMCDPLRNCGRLHAFSSIAKQNVRLPNCQRSTVCYINCSKIAKKEI